jgi:hypothetical protein
LLVLDDAVVEDIIEHAGRTTVKGKALDRAHSMTGQPTESGNREATHES